MPARPQDLPDAQPTAKIFISYSRKDMAFADRLEAALKARGFEPLIDREAIGDLEDWRKRIETLIVQSDTVVFILSPDAVASHECKKEVELAAVLNKRFAPIIWRTVDETQEPDALERINRIDFVDAPFDDGVDRLVRALTVDIAWIRKHTEYGEAARRWAAAGRPGPRGLLLRSPALEEAEHWMAARPRGAPEPTAETRAFVVESRRAASRRRNLTTGALAAGLAIALGLAALAESERETAVGQKNQVIAEEQKLVIEEMNRRAALAQQLATAGRAQLAAAVALDALPAGKPDQLLTPQARAAVQRTLNLIKLPVAFDAGANVFNIAVSPDGNTLAAGTVTGRVYVLDPSTLAVRFQFEAVDDVVSGLDFSPDSSRLVVSGGRIPTVWDVATGKKLFDLQRGDARKFTTRSQFSPDGKRIVIGTAENRALIYDADSGGLLLTLPGASYEEMRDRLRAEYPDDLGVLDPVADAVGSSSFLIWGAATDTIFSPDGKMVAVTGPANPDGSVRLFDAATGTLLQTLGGGRGTLMTGVLNYGNTLAFNPDGTRVIAAPLGRTIKVWNVRDAQLLAEFPIRNVNSFLLTKDGQAVVSAQENGSLIFRCLARDSAAVSVQAHDATINTLSVDRSGALMATASDDRTARVWRMPRGSDICDLQPSDDAGFDAVAVLRPVAILTGHGSRVSKAEFSANGRALITASKDGRVRTYPVFNADALAIPQPPPTDWLIEPEQALVAGDGHTLFLLGYDRRWHGWDGATGKPVEIPDDVQAIAPGDRNHAPVLFDAPGVHFALGAPPPERDGLAAITFASWHGPVSPDGSRVVMEEARSEDKPLADTASSVLIRSDTQEVLARLFANGEAAVDLRFSPDGSRLLGRLPAGSSVAVWDAQSGQLISVSAKIPGYDERSLVSMSQDGTRLLIGARLLFDVSKDGFKTIPVPAAAFSTDSAATAAALSADGMRVIIGRQDGTIAVADVAKNALSRVLDTQGLPIEAVAASPDGRFVVASDSSDTVWIFDSDADQPVRTETFPGAVLSFLFLSNSQRLAVLDERDLTIFPPLGSFAGRSDALSIAAAARSLGIDQVSDADRRRFNLDLPPAPGRPIAR